MSQTFILVFLCCMSVLDCSKVNYCGAKMCQHMDTHTFCRFFGGPSSRCVGYIEAPLSEDEQSRVLHRLNQRRAAVAAGRLPGFPTAGDMLKLMWIDELSHEAQLWADQCEPPRQPEERDDCRDLYSVTVGQCVASVIGEAPGLRPESMVDMWYMQNRHYKGNITSYDMPSNDYYGFYGDFAQLVYAKSFMVGCGRSRFMMQLNGRLRSIERLVCNFAPRGPSEGRALWTVASPGSACPPRSLPDDMYPALCVFQHDLNKLRDQDEIIPLEDHILLDTLIEVQKNKSLNHVGNIDELYLTKIAIARIIDPTTKIDDFYLYKGNTAVDDLANNTANIVSDEAAERDTLSFGVVITTPISKKDSIFSIEKTSLVGRPKSYKIEDLNENDGNKDTVTENSYFQMVDLPNTDAHFEADYEFDEHNEGKTAAIGRPSRTVTNTLNNIYNETISITTESLSHIIPSTREENLNVTASLTTGLTEITMKQIEIDALNSTIENITDALLDEYLSDPETLRQLQEELERMEQSSSTTQGEHGQRPEKVRRDLRDRFMGEKTYRINPESDQNFTQFPFTESDDNSTYDQVPMLNMIVRYVPFLKDYKKIIFNKISNSQGKTISNLYNLLILVLVNIFVEGVFLQ